MLLDGVFAAGGRFLSQTCANRDVDGNLDLRGPKPKSAGIRLMAVGKFTFVRTPAVLPTPIKLTE